jgi:polygalacturonase
MSVRPCLLLVYGLLSLSWIFAPDLAWAQDSRSVPEPTFPAVCAVVTARLQASADGPVIGQSADEQNEESAFETATLNDALAGCPAGKAVELALDATRSDSAFLINPITIPTKISLIVDGGVTVYASRDPRNFQDPAMPATVCGTVKAGYKINQGCKPLLTLGSDSGIYGYGILDGQGNGTLIGGENAGQSSWWGLLAQKKGCADCLQASPRMISSVNPQAGHALNHDVTLYKITIRNPPFHTVDLGGKGVTVWGVKVQAPWNVPNTDGFDIHGTDITIRDSIVANGDQDIAITSTDSATTNVTVEHFRAYGKGGIALLGDGVEISHVLVQDMAMTGDLPSVVGTTVNGMTEAMMMDSHGLKNYGQALPNATGDLNALQINTNLNAEASASKPGSVFTSITFQSICVQDVETPIHVGPVQPFASPYPAQPPVVNAITFRKLHVLAPTAQFLAATKGLPTPGTQGSYAVTFQALPQGGFLNSVTLDDVVFDDAGPGTSGLSTITAIGNLITTQDTVYPATLNNLQASYAASPSAQNGLTLSANLYIGQTTSQTKVPPDVCPKGRWPYLTGEFYAGAIGATDPVVVVAPASGVVTLNAIVQPIMSQTTLFILHSYGANPGLLAVGSPAPTGDVLFYEGARMLGRAPLTANRTLASFEVTGIAPGVHRYRAVYPGDGFYPELDLGSVTVAAGPVPAAAGRD